jgi:hypothetical protein
MGSQRTFPSSHFMSTCSPKKSFHHHHFPPFGCVLEYLHRSPAIHRRRWKGSPVSRGYNWATLSLGGINTETWSSRLGVGCKADDLAQLKKIIVTKSRKVKNRCSLVGSSKEGCGSKMAVCQCWYGCSLLGSTPLLGSFHSHLHPPLTVYCQTWLVWLIPKSQNYTPDMSADRLHNDSLYMWTVWLMISMYMHLHVNKDRPHREAHACTASNFVLAKIWINLHFHLFTTSITCCQLQLYNEMNLKLYTSTFQI